MKKILLVSAAVSSLLAVESFASFATLTLEEQEAFLQNLETTAGGRTLVNSIVNNGVTEVNFQAYVNAAEPEVNILAGLENPVASVSEAAALNAIRARIDGGAALFDGANPANHIVANGVMNGAIDAVAAKIGGGAGNLGQKVDAVKNQIDNTAGDLNTKVGLVNTQLGGAGNILANATALKTRIGGLGTATQNLDGLRAEINSSAAGAAGNALDDIRAIRATLVPGSDLQAEVEATRVLADAGAANAALVAGVYAALGNVTGTGADVQAQARRVAQVLNNVGGDAAAELLAIRRAINGNITLAGANLRDELTAVGNSISGVVGALTAKVTAVENQLGGAGTLVARASDINTALRSGPTALNADRVTNRLSELRNRTTGNNDIAIADADLALLNVDINGEIDALNRKINAATPALINGQAQGGANTKAQLSALRGLTVGRNDIVNAEVSVTAAVDVYAEILRLNQNLSNVVQPTYLSVRSILGKVVGGADLALAGAAVPAGASVAERLDAQISRVSAGVGSLDLKLDTAIQNVGVDAQNVTIQAIPGMLNAGANTIAALGPDNTAAVNTSVAAAEANALAKIRIILNEARSKIGDRAELAVGGSKAAIENAGQGGWIAVPANFANLQELANYLATLAQ